MPFFYLAGFRREVGDTQGALQALSEASQHRFGEMEWVPYLDDYCYWLAATFAYLEQQSDLVLALCDRWVENDRRHRQSPPEPHVLCAAAYLAKGDIVKARGSMVRAIEMKGDRAIWAKNLDSLAHAIEQGDSDYRWSPGSHRDMDDDELFIIYQ